jgi:hypothetical protein
MNDGKPFGIGGIWKNWKDPATGEWIISTDANPAPEPGGRPLHVLAHAVRYGESSAPDIWNH